MSEAPRGVAVALVIVCVACCVCVSLAVVIPLALLAGHGSLPTIPCRYTAVIRNTIEPAGQPARSSKLRVYLDGTSYRAVYLNDSTVGWKSGSLTKVGNTVAMVEPFFDRTVCTLLWRTKASLCVRVSQSYTKECDDCPCPLNASKSCDHWVYASSTESQVVYLESGTNLPVRILTIVDDSMTTTIDYISIDQSSPFPDGTFDISTDDCNDLQWVGRSTSTAEESVNSPSVIKEIAENAITWTPGANNFFAGQTLQQAWKLTKKTNFMNKPLGNSLQTRNESPTNTRNALPDIFDSRDRWQECAIYHVRDQASCGGCYAFAAAKTLEDRFCIDNGTIVRFSPVHIMSCHTRQRACDGGFTDLLWEDLMSIGVKLESCIPTPSKPYNRNCPSSCDNNTGSSSAAIYRVTSVYSIFEPENYSETARLMQLEIMERGPIEVSFYVFSDFYRYKKGVYHVTQGSSFSGGHAVTIIGWGVQNSTDGTSVPYWVVANSWGETWGESGFFRIRRGTNEAGIEDYAVAGFGWDIIQP